VLWSRVLGLRASQWILLDNPHPAFGQNPAQLGQDQVSVALGGRQPIIDARRMALERYHRSRLYPRGVKVLLRRRWLDHAVFVAGTSAAGGTSGDDPLDTLRPVRGAALPHENQGSASARRSRTRLRSLHQGNPGNAVCRRTEAVRIRVSGGLGPLLAAEVLAGGREETVRGGVRERPRRRDQRPWRPLSSRMSNARQWSQVC
jgi:hypothetical protein